MGSTSLFSVVCDPLIDHGYRIRIYLGIEDEKECGTLKSDPSSEYHLILSRFHAVHWDAIMMMEIREGVVPGREDA